MSSVRLALLATVVVTSLFYGFAKANVMGIDLGSEFIKIAAIRPRTGIDIVLNEQSRRKTFQFIGFRGEDRYIGEDAKNLSPRFPFNMISMLNRIVGISYDDLTTREWFTKELMHTYELLPNERRKTIDIRIQNNPTKVFDVETLLGIIFSYLRVITKEHNDGFEITEAVLVTPSFFTARQRRALTDAARLGGIKILGMINTTTAIALQYGIQNRGFSKPVDVVIYDMGTSRTEIGVYTITPAPKGAKKAESLGTITTKFIGSDAYLGGRNFDACLARKVASGIAGTDVLHEIETSRNGAKHAVILMRAANKAREILSANKDTPITFEGVLPNQMDYTTKVKREEFEAWCAPLFQRAMDLVRRAFASVSTPPTDLHAFEVHGGAVRMPKFLDEMQQLLTRPVNRTLNGDESAALGAAYYAARLSGSFVVRSFAIQEVHSENITFRLSPLGKAPTIPSPEGTEATAESALDATLETPTLSETPSTEYVSNAPQRSLFVNATLPRRRRITVSRAENFNVTFYSNNEWDSELHLLDLPSVLQDLGFGKPDKDANNTHTVRLEMRLNESGLLELEHAKAKYNEWVTVSKRVKVPVNETSTTDATTESEATNADGENPNTGDARASQEDTERQESTPPSSEDASSAHDQTTSDAVDESADANTQESQDGSDAVPNTTPEASNASTAEDATKKPTFEYRQVQERKQKHHQKKLSSAMVYRDPQPMNQNEFEVAVSLLKGMTEAEARKRETASAKNDLESMIIGLLGDSLEEEYGKYVTPEETETIQAAARRAREWLEDGDGANEDATKAQFVDQLEKIRLAMKTVTEKKKEHIEAIEKAKREAIQKAIEAEKARREAQKKESEKSDESTSEKESTSSTGEQSNTEEGEKSPEVPTVESVPEQDEGDKEKEKKDEL